VARKLLAGVAVVAALGAVAPAAADQMPLLRAAKAVHRHVVLQISVSDLRPIELTVAKRRAVNADGALLQKNVRLQEAIQIPASQTGVIRWQSHKTLRPGTYYVQVTAVQTVDVTDCPPKMRSCNERWSNVRRVVVRRLT
jgi:hypothetical protein